MRTTARPSPHDIAAWLLAGLGLVAVLVLHLLPALLAGLLVYQLTHLLAARLPDHGALAGRQRMFAVALLGASMVVLVSLGLFGLLAFFRSDSGSLTALLARMAEIIEGSRDKLPLWLAEHLPDGVDQLKTFLGDWLRHHGAELQTVGKEALHVAVRVLIGIVIGAMLAAREASQPQNPAPLAAALRERVRRLADAFHRIVFAQIKISAVNTLLTGIFLAALMPLLGIHLPLTKSMIAVTFVAGLIPVLGNLVSNVVIVVVSLSHSLEAASLALAFLIVVHKLEYFLNARIVGAGVGAQAWELLLAMLIMETIFGIPGVVAAPIYYAYIKRELADRQLV